jgi:hypothetical protein
MGLSLSNMTGLALHSSVPKCPETNIEENEDDDYIDDEDGDEDDEVEKEEDNDFEDDFSDEDDDDDEGDDLKENIKRKTCDTDEEIKELENASNTMPCTSGASSSSLLSSKVQTENLYKKLKTSNDVKTNDKVNREDDIESKLSTPKCYLEVRRWKQGAYTLVNDDDEEIKARALDLMVFFKCKMWSLECGGNVSYIARDEDNEVCICLLEKKNDLYRGGQKDWQ